jgi:hypothetical protein
VRLNTRVSSLAIEADRFVVTTDGATFTAHSVIVATGAYHRAYIPAFASAFSPSLVQRHSSVYRNPGALPAGGVLVVGAGNSGARLRSSSPNRAALPGCQGATPAPSPDECLGAMCTTGCGGRGCAHPSIRRWVAG